MHTTFHDPSSSGSNFRLGGVDSSPWAVVDQRSTCEIGLMITMSLNYISILNIKGSDYRCIIS